MKGYLLLEGLRFTLQALTILAIVSVVAIICAVVFLLSTNFYNAYTNAKKQGENGNWKDYGKETIKDFYNLCRDFDWVKKIAILIKQTNAVCHERPDNGLGGVILNKNNQLPKHETDYLGKPSHVKCIIKRLKW